MNENQIFEAIGETDEEILSVTEEKPENNNSWIKWAGIAAAVCIAAVGTIICGRYFIKTADGETISTESTMASQNTTVAAGKYDEDTAEEKIAGEYSPETRAMLLSAAVYPEMPPYPDETAENFEEQYDAWRAFQNEYSSRNIPTDYKTASNDFTQDSMSIFLTDSGNENMLVSPINIYFALGLLAETSDGNSRQQILDVAGAENIETLREYCNSMWKMNYSADGAFTSIFANSAWLSDSLEFNMDTLKLLSDNYYADTFSGNVSDKAYTEAFQDWLNVKTCGLLKNEVSELEFDPETVFALASTVYFRGKWKNEFKPENTEKDIFTTASGEQLECDFMKRESEACYFWGENYGAMRMPFEGTSNAKMWVFLPDEDVSTDELIKSGEIVKLITDTSFDYPDCKNLIVNFAIPKFDTSYTTDLKEGLTEMGITDVFDGAKADFSAMLTDTPGGTALSKAQHSVRVAIDEEGCTASAFTAMAICGAAMPPDEKMDFILDRPFVFIIQGSSGDTLFAGVINNPSL